MLEPARRMGIPEGGRMAFERLVFPTSAFQSKSGIVYREGRG